AGVLEGLATQQNPPAATAGNAYDADLPQLPVDWAAAIVAFDASAALKAHLNPQFCDVFTAMKQQELNRFTQRMCAFEVSTYLTTV
ncbi:MAG TPA: glutamine synthetase, partial [Rhodobacteraceae bacterium]|nr:glutamine synthetase [Paracoccaceae bacterium]